MTHPDAMRELALRARRSGETIGFVPTMGALHDGHATLFARARGENRRLAVSVFVNPLQFGPSEDFARYPRNDLNDARVCRGEGVDWLYMPTVHEVYPPGFATQVTPGPMADEFEGAIRPGHFTGVLTVVLKLLETVRPHTLYLGQKDAQQAALVGRMLRDLDVPVHLTVSPTVRERDGLAYSSRNAYLSPDERLRARGLPKALKAAREAARNNKTIRAILADARRTLQKEAKPDKIDYLAVVDPRTFEPITRLESRGLLIAAIRIGRTRLIDNMSLSAPRS